MIEACGAKQHRASEVRLFGGVRRNRRTLMMTTALQAAALLVLAVPAATPGHAQPAPNARPMGGQVVVGQASIAASATTTAITQGSQRAAIDWRSFDVGSQHSVTFAQPSSSAIALNRVTGPDPSQIAGKITANGQVALVNQSGVVFYKGSQVNVSTLIVSAAGITNQNFAAGRMIFDQPARPNARIENHGDITVKQAGLAALVAPQVANSGTITAKLGHVVLAGATTHTVVDLYGDGLLSIDVTGQVRQVPVGPDGKKATALVTNTGVIGADGGTITLTAQAADGIVQNLVSAGGKLRANSVGDKAGTIQVAGIGGSVTIAGAATAEGVAPGTRGGRIELAASNAVRVVSGATVNASGRAGGGTVAVGTTLARARGGAAVRSTRTAKSTVVESGATIRADATAQGDGGRVVLLSTEQTDHAGTITARGGAQGGNGGFVEVSGDHGFALTGDVNVSAPSGRLGTILIDPRDLTIGKASTDDGIVGTTAPQVGYNTAPFLPSYYGIPDAFISVAKVNRLRGNIQLQASRDLTVDGAISLGLMQALTLQAGHNLTVTRHGSISTQGDITLTAAAPQPPPPFSPSYPGFSTAGALTLNGAVTTSAGAIRLSAGTGGIVLRALVSGTSVNLATTGDATEPNGAITTNRLTGTVDGALHLAGHSNQIDVLGNLTVTGGNFTLVDNVPLAISGPVLVSAPGAYIGITDTAPAGTAIGITGSLTAGTPSAPDGIVRLETTTAGANVIEAAGGSLATGALEGPIAGSLDLSLGTNVIRNIGAPFGLIVAGDLILADSVPAVVGGAVQATNISLIDTAPVVGSSAITITSGGSLVTARPGGALNLTTATGDVTEPGGFITTASLNGSVGGALHLAGHSNRIDALGNLAVSGGNLTLVDYVPLTVGGPVLVSAPGAYVGITDTAPAGTAIGITGSLTAGTPSTPDGIVRLETTTAGANVIEAAGGSLATGSLEGPIAGTLDLSAGTNTIASIGSPFGLIVAGDLILADSVPVVLGGIVQGANVTLNDTGGSITQTAGVLIAGTLSGSSVGATSLTGATAGTNQIGTLGNFSAAGFALNDGQSLTVSGTLNGGPSATLLDQGILTINSGATVTAAAIGMTSGNIVIGGTATDGGAGTVSLVANSGSIQDTGTLIAGALQLRSAVSITRSGGTLIARTLTGNSGTSADLGSGASIGTLGNFTVTSGDFALGNDQPLILTGLLSAPNLRVSAVGQITLTGNISTVGAPPFAQEGAAPAPSGSYLVVQPDTSGMASLVQSGTSIVSGLDGNPATLRLQLPATGGRMQFADLEAPFANLVLGTGTGVATGIIRSGTLFIVGAGGSATLVGAVNGNSGPGAAALAGISQINAAYTFNRCTIGTTTVCTGVSSQQITAVLGGLAEYGLLPGGLPALPSLPELVVLTLPSLVAPAKQLTDPDVVPPNISVQDY